MKRQNTMIGAFAALLAAGTSVLAAPTVTAIQGTVGSHQAITIQGAGFGSKSPAAPLVWADFESGLNPGAGGQKAAWDQVQSMDWDRGEGYGGGNCAKATDGGGVWSLRTDYDAWTRDGQTVYIYKKQKANFLITDASQNWKTWRMWCTGNTYPNIYSASNNGRVYVEKVNDSIDSGFYGSFKADDLNWMTNEIIFRASTIDQKNGYVQMRYDGQTVAEGAVETRSSSAPGYMTWNYVFHMVQANASTWSPAWSNNNRVWVDDLYVDTTWARVLLGNAGTYASSTHIEIQIPTAWSDGSISILGNAGTFSVGSKAYLYVIDKDGNVNANGYPVTIGGAGTATAGEPVASGAPVANAGPDMVAAVNTVTPLHGAINTNGAASAVSAHWTIVSGPGDVKIADPENPDTTATFSAPGDYVLQLAASGDQGQSVDTVSVTTVQSVGATGVQPKNVFNPANGETYKIVYLLDAPSRVEAEIIDRTGQRVRNLDGGDRPGGEQYLEWDGRNDSGDVVASGIYLVVKKFNGKHATTKVAVIK